MKIERQRRTSGTRHFGLPGPRNIPGGLLTAVVLLCMILVGCAARIIPDPLAEEIDPTLTFSQLAQDPEAYRGKKMALGGEILEASNLKEGTLLEILQLPLDSASQPDEDVKRSQGRFLLLHPGFLDPAIFHKGRRVTAVGEVVGAKVRPLGEIEYTYPFLSARFIHLWTPTPRYVYPHYPYPAYPYFCRYPWPSPFWWDPYCFYPWSPPPRNFPMERPNDPSRNRRSRSEAPLERALIRP